MSLIDKDYFDNYNTNIDSSFELALSLLNISESEYNGMNIPELEMKSKLEYDKNKKLAYNILLNKKKSNNFRFFSKPTDYLKNVVSIHEKNTVLFYNNNKSKDNIKDNNWDTDFINYNEK
uniref:Uncharacterized protein n=1 Tax=viral metagenome TaxID=1070528 RepID=A0A6C0H775_9ZZZZ